MKRLTFTLSIAFALVSCGGQETPQSPQDPPEGESRITIDPNGGTASSSDGNLEISFPPASLNGTATVTIAEARGTLPSNGNGRSIAVGPYDIHVEGADLQNQVTLRMYGPIDRLLAPEIWVLRDGVWRSLETEELSDDFVAVEVDEFSVFSLYQTEALSPAGQTGLIPLESGKWHKGMPHGIGESSQGYNGWVTPGNSSLGVPQEHFYLPGALISIRGAHDCGDADNCRPLRGAGGEIESADPYGSGWFSARVRVGSALGSRYALFLFKDENEATIELDYRTPEDGPNGWKFLLSTFRMDGGRRQTTYACQVDISDAALSDGSFHIITLHRTETVIDAYLDGALMASTSRNDCPDPRTSKPHPSTKDLPTGKLHLLLNAWPPSTEEGFAAAPNPARSDTYEIQWVGIGWRPIAHFTISDTDPLLGQQVTFDASGSVDLNGASIELYDWDLDDGAGAVTSSPTISRAYNSEGTKTIRLTVTDSEGDISDEITASLTVSCHPEVEVPSPDVSTLRKALELVCEGGRVLLSPGTYTDTIGIPKGVTIEATGGGPVILRPREPIPCCLGILEVGASHTHQPVVVRGITFEGGAVGISVWSGGHITVENSTFQVRNGILVHGRAIVRNNEFVRSDILAQNAGAESDIEANTFYGSGEERCIIVEHDAVGRVERNRVLGCRLGVRVNNDGSATINFNDIVGNGTGMWVVDNPEVDATCNWWGSSDGPSGDFAGSGDAVSGAADVSPFATSAIAQTGRTSCSGGF